MDDAGSTCLRAAGIVKRFGGVRALDGADMELYPNEVLGLIGPNGSGKTTLVNCISGQLRLDDGVISLGGLDLAGKSRAERARRGLARTFQTPKLFHELTVTENVQVGLSASKLARLDGRQTVEHLISRLQLTDVARTAVSGLPYGQQRRIELARALAGNPSFLLLDEPAAGLNDSETAELQGFIREICADYACGVLLIDHDMALVMKASDRLQVLDEGRVIFHGAPADAFKQPHVVEAYLGIA